MIQFREKRSYDLLCLALNCETLAWTIGLFFFFFFFFKMILRREDTFFMKIVKIQTCVETLDKFLWRPSSPWLGD